MFKNEKSYERQRRKKLVELRKQQAESPSFFYSIQLDVDDLITNVFWHIYGRMIIDYSHFADADIPTSGLHATEIFVHKLSWVRLGVFFNPNLGFVGLKNLMLVLKSKLIQP